VSHGKGFVSRVSSRNYLLISTYVYWRTDHDSSSDYIPQRGQQ